MGVVLAIAPGDGRATALDRLHDDLRGHDVLVAASGDEALDLLDLQVPDLVVFPLFLAPGDEAKLQAQLSDLTTSADLTSLTLPLRAFFDGEGLASRPAAVPPRWFYWFKPESAAGFAFDDPQAFADSVRSALGRPRAGSDTEKVGAPTVLVAPPSATQVEPHASPSLVAALPLTTDSAPTSPALAAAQAAPFRDEPRVVVEGPSTIDFDAPLESTLPLETEQGPGRLSSVLGALRAASSGAARAAAQVGPALAGLWRVAQGMPRAAWVAMPVVIILLTLGVTGRMGRLIAMPGEFVAATKARIFPAKPRTGIAEIQSVPDGAEVWMNGRQIGVTPMRTEFAVGSHEVELRHRGTTRSLILDVLPGATVVQRVEWAAPRAAVGRLRIESDPAGAIVAIDGTARGITPLTTGDLPVGRHTIEFSLHGNTVREVADVKASKTTTVRASVYQGWLALFSPIELKVAVDGRALSLDDQNRLLLAAGQHELTLQNRALGFLESRTVAIKAGETTALSVNLPRTALTVAASGPAEVWVDGTRVGDAPIVDLPIEIGTHDVLIRSAEHGERRVAVTATMAPVRLDVDFSATAP